MVRSVLRRNMPTAPGIVKHAAPAPLIHVTLDSGFGRRYSGGRIIYRHDEILAPMLELVLNTRNTDPLPGDRQGGGGLRVPG